MATFTTAGGGVIPMATLKLIRLDGTKLDLTAKPIPLRVAIEATFSAPMDQATVEAAMTVTDDAGTAIPGTFSWNADYTVATYTLSKNLGYKGTYHVKIAATASSKGTMAAVDQTFVTMTRGDVNGDGYAEVIVGADSAVSKGIVYVFSGATIASATGPGNAMATLTGTDTDGKFGSAVSAAGDVNGDGYADVLASAQYADAGGNSRGATYLFSGATLADTTAANATASFTGTADFGNLGAAIAILQDINNDGCDEVGVASQSLSMGALGRGGAYIFSGSPTISGPIVLTSALATIRGGEDKDALGSSIAAAGDINGDGTPDVIIGAPSAPGGANNGAAYVFNGATLVGSIDANSTMALAMISGISANDMLGDSVAGPGDINGDGRDDVVVTAGGYNAGGTAGAAYFFDGTTLSGTKTAADNFSRVAGKADGDYMGFNSRELSGIGDFNADGHVDILIGASAVGFGKGEAYVFSGAALNGNLSATSAFSTFTALTGDELGRYVSGGVDVNADGVPDFIIGAFGAPNGTYDGQAYVFSGATLTGTTTLANALSTLTAAAAGDQFGASVSAQ